MASLQGGPRPRPPGIYTLRKCPHTLHQGGSGRPMAYGGRDAMSLLRLDLGASPFFGRHPRPAAMSRSPMAGPHMVKNAGLRPTASEELRFANNHSRELGGRFFSPI